MLTRIRHAVLTRHAALPPSSCRGQRSVAKIYGSLNAGSLGVSLLSGVSPVQIENQRGLRAGGITSANRAAAS